MSTKKQVQKSDEELGRPFLSNENHENYLISLAYKRAEEQLLNGTASSQVISHFLKLGSMKESMEKEKLEHEIELLRAKTDAIESAKRVEELYANALSAMRTYSGNPEPEMEEEFYE